MHTTNCYYLRIGKPLGLLPFWTCYLELDPWICSRRINSNTKLHRRVMWCHGPKCFGGLFHIKCIRKFVLETVLNCLSTLGFEVNKINECTRQDSDDQWHVAAIGVKRLLAPAGFLSVIHVSLHFAMTLKVGTYTSVKSLKIKVIVNNGLALFLNTWYILLCDAKFKPINPLL